MEGQVCQFSKDYKNELNGIANKEKIALMVSPELIKRVADILP